MFNFGIMNWYISQIFYCDSIHNHEYHYFHFCGSKIFTIEEQAENHMIKILMFCDRSHIHLCAFCDINHTDHIGMTQ